jgi:hypothetical protein
MIDREHMAQGIIAGTFFESDLTPEEERRANAVAEGFYVH